MICQVALAVITIVLFFALLWGGSLYFEREEAREDLVDLREDFEEARSSREMWRALTDKVTADRDEALRERDDFKRCFESTERERDDARKERDAYKKAKAEDDERFMTERDAALALHAVLKDSRDAALSERDGMLCKITDLDNLVCRIENAPLPENVKGSYRITAIRGPYRKTRERLARRAARLGRASRAGRKASA